MPAGSIGGRQEYIMATTRELRDRISSIDNTLKITNAMYLISSTKLRKAKTDLAKTEPYFYTLQTMILP